MVSMEEEGGSISFARLSQILGGIWLRFLYLAKKVALQLEPIDEPRVLVSPPLFMLAPKSMTAEELELWADGIDFYIHLLSEEEDYDLFSEVQLTHGDHTRWHKQARQ